MPPEWRDYRTREEAEDALAIAFSKLPEYRRNELLSPEGENT